MSKNEKKLYNAMKIAAKNRKIKLSAEQDLYKKCDPYFFDVFWNMMESDQKDKIKLSFDIEVKYWHYDELQWSITNPGDDLKFTDKVRANSVAKCRANFPTIEMEWDFDYLDESYPIICETVLDYLEKWYRDFFEKVKNKYGTLKDFYIANEKVYPNLAALTYIEKKDFKAARKCYENPKAYGRNIMWSVTPKTEEQKIRLETSNAKETGTGSYYRSNLDAYIDYTIAMENGVEWDYEKAKYGLLPKEI